METITIGQAPIEEKHAEVGVTKDALIYTRIECRAYAKALLYSYGPSPDGAYITVEGKNNDNCAVVVKFDENNWKAKAWAQMVADEKLCTWKQAGMRPPVIYDNEFQVVAVEVSNDN